MEREAEATSTLVMYNGYLATERAKIVCGRVQVVNINTLDYPVSSCQNKIRQYVFSEEIAKINLRQYFMLYGMCQISYVSVLVRSYFMSLC